MEIRRLTGPERVRLRPAVIFGDDGIEGAQCAVEMMLCIMASECIDGYSPSLEVTLFQDNSIEIKDSGRGIFFGDPGQPDDSIWKDMFCEIYAGSRYLDSIDTNSRYSIFAQPGTTLKREYSIKEYDDLYLCAVQYASEYMDIVSVRDNYKYILNFKKGYNAGGLQKTTCNQPNGTQIRFKLDREVFSDIDMPQAFFADQLEILSLLNPGIVCTFKTEGRDDAQVFSFPTGIVDYITCHISHAMSTPIFSNTIEGMGQERYNRPAYKAKVEVALSFAANNGYIKCFHNQRELTYSGTHVNALLSKICNYLSFQTGVSPSLELLRQHLQLVVSSYSYMNTHWENGTRRSIRNTVIRDMAEDTLDDRFRDFLKDNTALVEQIFAT